jgi:fructose-bisphosphate aldolase class II
MLLLFPWAQTYSSTVLATAAAEAARTATVPITIHLDHAQSPKAIHEAADTGCYDSIMVDMSHHEKEENLRLTQELTTYCHERGIVTEAEPGRITGGEDGVMDTADLEAVMTSPEEAREFVDTGIDWLAPAFGNVHGNYGPRGIQLEYERLNAVNEAVGKDVRLVLHGTDGFDDAIFKKCIKGGITKVNINKFMNKRYMDLQNGNDGKLGLTQLMEEGTKRMQEAIEECIEMLGSGEKA